MHHYDLICIGGGSGGLATAIRASKHGASVLVVEPNPLGGTCVHRGCVPKKIMWSAASLRQTLTHAQKYGLTFSKVDFSWNHLIEHRDAYIRNSQKSYERKLATEAITVIQGHARFYDAKTLIVNDKNYSAEHIVIASGSHPVRPDIPGSSFGITSDEFFELKKQPKNICIVGAGYIAVELATTLASLGSNVSLAIRTDEVLRRFDPLLRTHALANLIREGVQIITQATPRSLQRNADASYTLNFDNGHSIDDVDTVLWAIGRDANTHDLDLAAAGVSTDSNGFISVDAQQNSSTANIYALGDVTGKMPLTPVAIAAGRKLANRLFANHVDAQLDYEFIPTVVFGHPAMGAIGMTEPEAKERFGEKQIKVYQTQFTSMFDSLLTNSAPTAMKLICTGEHEKIVGCHLVGTGVDEMLQGFAVAIKMGACKSDFENTVAIHPTSAEELVTLI